MIVKDAYVSIRRSSLEIDNQNEYTNIMRTHPTKRNQAPFLCKLQNQLFFKHRTSITRRCLFRNQQRRHRKPGSFIFS